MPGQVVGIYIAPEAGAPMQSLTTVNAITGAGLEGDRYAANAGTFSRVRKEVLRHITFIEEESIDEVCEDYGLPLTAALTRRNIITRGIELIALVGKTFRINGVLFRGVECCSPCSRPGELSGNVQLEAQLKKALTICGGGGLRAEIVAGGMISVEDQIFTEMDDQLFTVSVFAGLNYLTTALTTGQRLDLVVHGLVQGMRDIHTIDELKARLVDNDQSKWKDIPSSEPGMARMASRVLMRIDKRFIVLLAMENGAAPLHTHPGGETIISLGGRLIKLLPHSPHEMKPGDIVYLPPDSTHQTETPSFWIGVYDQPDGSVRVPSLTVANSRYNVLRRISE